MAIEKIQTISIEEYNYHLPNEKIAFHPKNEREKSKLLVYNGGKITDETFEKLPQLLSSNDFLVFNDTRVINARLWFKKPTGKIIEIFCLEPKDLDLVHALSATTQCTWRCLVGGAKRWKHNPLSKEVIIHNQKITVMVTKEEYKNNAFDVFFEWNNDTITFSEILEHLGKIPLPPYIKRDNTPEDESRYQTVYSHYEGSVAAPTAGLHFSESILNSLKKNQVMMDFLTLHVGAGTFKPVTSTKIGNHDMHFEIFEVSLDFLKNLRANLNKRIIPVGTTSCRTLESLYWLGVKLLSGEANSSSRYLSLSQWDAYVLANKNITVNKVFEALIIHAKNNGNSILGKTQLMIAPGYTYKVVGGIITNFHLPKSTLLLLVSALVSQDWKEIYQHALHHEYRFLSYGDSSLLLPA